MRLWSISPKYLDSRGLVALWREALLAQKVLQGKTKGYRNHPQLERFKAHRRPLNMIGAYLYFVYLEAKARGYTFDAKKITVKSPQKQSLHVTLGQLAYEFKHLKRKLKIRDPRKLKEIKNLKKVSPHPLFKKKKGGIATWERFLAR